MAGMFFVGVWLGAVAGFSIGLCVGHRIRRMETTLAATAAKVLETERDMLADELRSRDRLRHHESVELN